MDKAQVQSYVSQLYTDYKSRLRNDNLQKRFVGWLRNNYATKLNHKANTQRQIQQQMYKGKYNCNLKNSKQKEAF